MNKAKKLESLYPIRIMGIDPGSLIAGVAVIVSKNKKPLNIRDYVVQDVLTLQAKKDLHIHKRAQLFHNTLYNLLTEYKPTHVVLESGYFGINAQSSLKLGLIRGAMIAAVGRCSMDISEITPAQVKKIITGNGHATKEQITFALKTLIGYDATDLSYDATDALAVGLSYGIGVMFL